MCNASLAPSYFLTLSDNRHDFRKKVIEHKTCALIFSTNFILNISRYEKNSARYCDKCVKVFMLSTRYSFRILMKLEFFRQIFRKNLNTKLHKNLSSCSRTDGRTDGRGNAVFFEILRTRLKPICLRRRYK
jgi:hypothetical protein